MEKNNSHKAERFNRAIKYVHGAIDEMTLTFHEVDHLLNKIEMEHSDLDSKLVDFSEICVHLIGSHQLMLQNLSLAAKSCAEALSHQYRDQYF